MFEDLFEHVLNYEVQLRHSVTLALPAFISETAMVTLPSSLSHCRSNNCGYRNPNRSL